MGIFHEPFKRFLIPVRRYIKISCKTLLEKEREREDPSQFSENFEMGKGVRRISKGCRGSHGFAASDGCLRRKGYVKTARLGRQRGSYLEFLKSHLPSCPLQRFFSPLAPFHPPRNPFTQGGFLARDIVISGVFHSSVYSDIFFFFSLSFLPLLTDTSCLLQGDACGRKRRAERVGEVEEGNSLRVGDDV